MAENTTTISQRCFTCKRCLHKNIFTKLLKSRINSIKTGQKVICEIFKSLYEPQNKKTIFTLKQRLVKNTLGKL